MIFNLHKASLLLASFLLLFSCKTKDPNRIVNPTSQNETSLQLIGSDNSFGISKTCQLSTCDLSIVPLNKKTSSESKIFGACTTTNSSITLSNCINSAVNEIVETSPKNTTFFAGEDQNFKVSILQLQNDSSQIIAQAATCSLKANSFTSNEKKWFDLATVIEQTPSQDLIAAFAKNELNGNNSLFNSIKKLINQEGGLGLAGEIPHISTIQTDKHPVKVTIYNQPATGWTVDQQRMILKYAGHSVLYVQDLSVPHSDGIMVSYLKKDVEDLEKLENLPADQKATFYVSKENYLDFLITYRTSPVSYKKSDIFTMLDELRRRANPVPKESNIFPEWLDYLKKRAEARKKFLLEKYPEMDLSTVTEEEMRSALSDFVFPSEFEEYEHQLKDYDVYDAMLSKYREGKKISFSGKTYQLNLNFKKDENFPNQEFEKLSKESGKRVTEIKQMFYEATLGFTEFTEEREKIFREKLGGKSNVSSLFSYFSQATLQRDYYNSFYDKYERNGKVNCAGAACPLISVLSNHKFSYTGDWTTLGIRTPQDTVNATHQMINELATAEAQVKGRGLKLASSTENCNPHSLIEIFSADVNEVFQGFEAYLLLNRSVELLLGRTLDLRR